MFLFLFHQHLRGDRMSTPRRTLLDVVTEVAQMSYEGISPDALGFFPALRTSCVLYTLMGAQWAAATYALALWDAHCGCPRIYRPGDGEAVCATGRSEEEAELISYLATVPAFRL